MPKPGREVVPTELVDIIAQEQLDIHLNIKSRTFRHKFFPTKDGVYTAAVKGVAHVELRSKMEAPRLRPLVLTGRELLRLEFEGKKGTAYSITIETVPTGAGVDAVLTIFSGAGRTARPLILRQPPKSHTLPQSTPRV